MWNVERIVKLCERLSRERGDEFSIPVSINGRLTATLGRVILTLNTLTDVCTPDKMEISRKLIENGTDEDLEKVIKHEWCHYYLAKTTKKNHGHNREFNLLAAEIGGSVGTTTVIEGYREIKTKYETFCTECGKLTGQYSRASKATKNPDHFSSGCCKKPIKVIQNW